MISNGISKRLAFLQEQSRCTAKYHRVSAWVRQLAFLSLVYLVLGCRSDKSSPLEVPAFPWPPPAASATERIPQAIVLGNGRLSTLGDIDSRLELALEKNGYTERSYYVVPDGFALVTRLEQIDADGTSKRPPARWSGEQRQVSRFSLASYLRSLFTANPGRYRVIAFIITDIPFSQAAKGVTFQESTEWLRGGFNVLPEAIAKKPYTPQHSANILIYEFEKIQGKEPALDQPSILGAHSHLVKSGIWAALGGKP